MEALARCGTVVSTSASTSGRAVRSTRGAVRAHASPRARVETRARVSTRARGDACARTAPRVDRTARPEVDADVETTVPQRASASIARVVVCARARTRATTPRRA